MAVNFNIYRPLAPELLQNSIFDQYYSGPAGIIDPAKSVVPPEAIAYTAPNQDADGIYTQAGPKPSNVETVQNLPQPAAPTQADWDAYLGINRSQASGANYNPSQFASPGEATNAWFAAGRPERDAQGRDLDVRGMPITFNGQQMSAQQQTQYVYGPQTSTPQTPQAPAPQAPAPQTTTPQTAAPNTTSQAPAGTTSTTLPATSGQQQTTTMPKPENNGMTSGQVVQGQLNADLSVSNPRRRVANAMIVRR